MAVARKLCTDVLDPKHTCAYETAMKTSEIVAQLLKTEFKKQQELASKLRVRQATVSRWLGGSEPEGETRDKLYALARERGIIQTSVKGTMARHAPASRFISVPIISWVSAGRLAEPTEQISYDDSPKLNIADLGEGEFFALSVVGTSMDRISPEKSTIVVNRRERALMDGKPFVFAVRGETTYKLWRSSPPRLVPYSTDPSNDTIFIDRRQSMEIVGRVRRTILDL